MCVGSDRVPVLKLIFFFISLSLVSAATGPIVSAALPGISWVAPAAEGTYYNEAFTANLSTNISSLCELLVLDVDNLTVDGGMMSTDDNLSHSFYIDALALAPGYAYSISVVCNDTTAPEDSAISSMGFNRDPVCGDTLYTSWTLGHDIACGSDVAALTLAAENMTLDCSDYSISNSASDGTGIDISSDGITVTGCEISGFAKGIYSSGTAGISLLSNMIHDNVAPEEPPMPVSGVALFNVQDSTISHNSIYSNDEGIYLSTCTGINITQNNIYQNTEGTAGSRLGLYDAGGNTNILLYNNYWGHTSCPLYSYQVDSNSEDIIDTMPVANESQWEQTIDCSSQANTAMFNSVAILLPDGTSTASPVPGFSYYYDSNNVRRNTTYNRLALGGQNVTAWKVYQYYYYPGQDIILDINLSPANYEIEDISLITSSLNEGYTFDVSPEGEFGAAGVYRLTISGYTINESDTWANGSYGIRNLDLKFVVTDNTGSARWVWLLAVYNFTPSQVHSSLAGDTTDWSAIPDLTAAENLTFQAVSNSTNVAKLRFRESLNLANVDLIHGLRSLSANLRFGNLSASLNSSALSALNRSAAITFYGLNTTLNLSNLTRKVKADSRACQINLCANYSYSNQTREFSFSVAHWTNYSMDFTPPDIIDKSPSWEHEYSSSARWVELSVTTDEEATCRYSTNVDDEYLDMDDELTEDDDVYSVDLAVTSGRTYNFYVACIDSYGNIMPRSERLKFSVDAATAQASSGGGGGSGNTTSTSGSEITTAGKRVAIVRNEVYRFRLGGTTESHTLRITSITPDGVIFTISSSPINVTVRLGEKKPVDFTGDGKADMTIELLSKSDFGVSFILTKVEEALAPSQGVKTAPVEQAVETGSLNESSQAQPAAAPPKAETNNTGEEAGNKTNAEVEKPMPNQSWGWDNLVWIGLSVVLIGVVAATVLIFMKHDNHNLALPKLDEKAVPKPEKPKGTKEKAGKPDKNK